jgi:predicted acylesterase/phospholipase RssA
VSYHPRSRNEHFDPSNGPKRILALDGGGLRGILTLGILEAVERTLRERHDNDAGFRLCHYFDLIAGTSTGAIIAAALAIGMSVADITDKYRSLGSRVFKRSLLRQGLLRARYNEAQLIDELKGVYGADTTLGGNRILTGLLLVIKRLDTASPWPVSNNPNGQFFASRPDGMIGNGEADHHRRTARTCSDVWRLCRRRHHTVQQSVVPGVHVRHGEGLLRELAGRRRQDTAGVGWHWKHRPARAAI